MPRRKKGVCAFTLLELLITIIVISVIVSMSMIGYRGYQDRVAAMVDETNQRIIQMALRMQAIDTGAIAGSLGELKLDYVERAYAKYLDETKERPSYTMLAYARELFGVPVAEAVPLQIRYLPDQVPRALNKLFRCPRDRTPAEFGTANFLSLCSYTVNPAAACASLSWMLRPANALVPLVLEKEDGSTSDCGNAVRNPADNPPLSTAGLAFRHARKTCALTATGGGFGVLYPDGRIEWKSLPSGDSEPPHN